MKFCTFRQPDGHVSAGFLIRGESGSVEPQFVVDMAEASRGALPGTMMELLQDADGTLPTLEQLAATLEAAIAKRMLARNGLTSSGVEDELELPGVFPLSKVELLSPLPRPGSIRDFYAFEAHVKTARQNRGLEMVPEWYDFPVFYFTNHQAVVGPEASVDIPPGCEWFDYELEIACVIGREGKNISAQNAAQHIFGFMIMNDWSARDLQREEMKVGLGPAKGKDFATSLGPWLVTPDELSCFLDEHPGPASLIGRTDQEAGFGGKRYNLEMEASVNGVKLSKGNCRDIYFTFEQMIERASRGVTLYPGDVIGSGTVGTGCILELGPKVHRWLQSGDVVELTISGLGTLRNTVRYTKGD